MPPHKMPFRFFSARLSEGRRLLRLVFHDSRVAGRDTQFVETKAGCAAATTATDAISIDAAMRPATTTAALSSMIERIQRASTCSVDDCVEVIFMYVGSSVRARVVGLYCVLLCCSFQLVRWSRASVGPVLAENRPRPSLLARQNKLKIDHVAIIMAQ